LGGEGGGGGGEERGGGEREGGTGKKNKLVLKTLVAVMQGVQFTAGEDYQDPIHTGPNARLVERAKDAYPSAF